jgi:hypothetical protein
MGRIIGEFNAASSLALAAAAHCRLVTIRIAGDAQIDRAVGAKVRHIDRAWTAGSFDNEQRLYESHPRFSKIALSFDRVRSWLASSRNCMISDFTNQYLALTITKTGAQDFRLAVSAIDAPRSMLASAEARYMPVKPGTKTDSVVVKRKGFVCDRSNHYVERNRPFGSATLIRFIPGIAVERCGETISNRSRSRDITSSCLTRPVLPPNT